MSPSDIMYEKGKMYSQFPVPNCGNWASVKPEIWIVSVSQSEAINDTSARVFVITVVACAIGENATSAAIARMPLRPFTVLSFRDSKRPLASHPRPQGPRACLLGIGCNVNTNLEFDWEPVGTS